MFKKNTTQWDQATKLHGLANLVGFYGLWNTIITEVQQITWSSSGTKKKKKKKKKTQYRIKENYQCFNFKPIIKNQEGKKSVWDPIQNHYHVFYTCQS